MNRKMQGKLIRCTVENWKWLWRSVWCFIAASRHNTWHPWLASQSLSHWKAAVDCRSHKRYLSRPPSPKKTEFSWGIQVGVHLMSKNKKCRNPALDFHVQYSTAFCSSAHWWGVSCFSFIFCCERGFSFPNPRLLLPQLGTCQTYMHASSSCQSHSICWAVRLRSCCLFTFITHYTVVLLEVNTTCTLSPFAFTLAWCPAWFQVPPVVLSRALTSPSSTPVPFLCLPNSRPTNLWFIMMKCTVPREWTL